MTSETFATGSTRTKKTTCNKCQRTVVVVEIDGELVFLDPELIAVVPFEDVAGVARVKSSKKIPARRSHSEMCMVYRNQAEKKKARILAKRST